MIRFAFCLLLLVWVTSCNGTLLLNQNNESSHSQEGDPEYSDGGDDVHYFECVEDAQESDLHSETLPSDEEDLVYKNTYYVDGNIGDDLNNGTIANPWKTITKAANTVVAGEEVLIRTATYFETIFISTPNTRWRADIGHKPVIDGRYNDSLMTDGKMPLPGAGHLPGGEYGNMVLVGASGVVIDGLTIQNCAGSGVGVGDVSDVVIRNCRIDFTRDNNINITGRLGLTDRIIVENNILTRGSVRLLVPELQNWGAAISAGGSRDVLVRNNLVAYHWGEGIDPHRGAQRTIVEGNIVHTCISTHIYIQRAKENIIRNNFVFHLGTPQFIWPNGRVSEGIMIADEAESVDFPHSEGDQVYNNIVVGCGILFNAANGGPTLDTQLNNTYIGYNTFVGGPRTFIGIYLTDNLFGRPFVNSLFENNIITNVPSDKPICQADGALTGLAFRNNLWDRQPPSQARGNGDQLGVPMLVNAVAAMESTYPDPSSKMNPGNYQLTSLSVLAIGLASIGSEVNGIQPPSIQNDFFYLSRDALPDIGAHEYISAP